MDNDFFEDNVVNEKVAYENLANAIIIQAVKDATKDPGMYYIGVVNFLKSQYFEILTNVNGISIKEYIDSVVKTRFKTMP